MKTDVKWAHGMEGSYLYGRDNVCEYRRKQLEILDPQLEPLEFERVEKKVRPIFAFEGGLISVFEIIKTD